MIKSSSRALVASTSFIVMSLAALTFGESPLSAQTDQDVVEDDPTDDSLIIVTARRREESLQEVPVAVTTVGGAVLDKFEVTNIDKLESRIPSLTVQQGGPNGGASLQLRGVGTANLSPAFQSAVALDFDGVQIGQLRILQAGFFDIEQADLLKGPQSLFFGKSASAGVLTLRSAGPTSTFEVTGRAGYEFEEEGRFAELTVSGPISETLGYRLAGRYSKIDELVINNAPGVANPERGSRDIYVRGGLRWDPSDEFTSDLKVDYLNSERDGAALFQDINCGPNGVADPIVLFGGGLVVPAGYDCVSGDGEFFLVDPAPALVAGVPDGFPSTTTPFHETEIWLGRWRNDIYLTDEVTLTSISGYYELDTIELDAFSYGGVVDGASFGTGLGFPNFRTSQFSQEIRLEGTDLGRLDFAIGAFYEWREDDADTPLYGANIGLLGPDPVTGFTGDSFKTQNSVSNAYSVFASGIFAITDSLDLAGGVRFTNESKSSTIRVPLRHLFLAGPPFGLEPGSFFGPIQFDDDNFSPEVSLTYSATDDINIYAAYKTGFKSGGIDSAVLPTLALEDFRAAGDFSSIIFDSEESKGFEVGVKAQFDDRNVTLNIVAYRYKFDDLQVQEFDPVAINFITLNASEILSQGVDLDFKWRTPVDGLTVSSTVNFLDAAYTDTFIPFTTDLDGREARLAPDWTGNVGFDWAIPLGDWSLTLNGNARFSSSYFVAANTLDDPRQDSYVTFDAGISLSPPSENFSLNLSALNVTDELYVTQSTGRPFLEAGVGDDVVESFNRGRQVFLTASFQY